MARRSIRATVISLFMGLLVAINIPAAGASRDCAGYAQEQCEAMVAAQDAAPLFTAPVHILSGNRMGPEQFEATEGDGYGTFLITVPTNATMHIENGYAPENYEQLAAVAVARN